MNMGKLITQLKRALSVPAGSSYVVAMGDGTGTKQVFHEDVVESVKRDLPLGNMEELGTENKTDIVGAVNEIVEKLSIVGISYKGGYNPEAEYNFLDAVFYENSTFIAMKNNPEGLPAADGINWQYLAKGFMDGYLIAKSQIVNNLLATEPGNVLDAMQGKALADMLGEINSNLAILNSTLVSSNVTDTITLPAGMTEGQELCRTTVLQPGFYLAGYRMSNYNLDTVYHINLSTTGAYISILCGQNGMDIVRLSSPAALVITAQNRGDKAYDVRASGNNRIFAFRLK